MVRSEHMFHCKCSITFYDIVLIFKNKGCEKKKLSISIYCTILLTTASVFVVFSALVYCTCVDHVGEVCGVYEGGVCV